MAAEDNDNDRTESIGDFGEKPDRPRIERLGHFRIESTLGSGGMGTIYQAYDESMKRPVALKVLHSSLEISERAQTRFVREAWIAGQLDHPNIVKVYTRGEENNVSFLAMELAEGGSLYDLIKQTQEQVPSGSDVTETIDQDYIKDILEKFVELVGALEHIHSKGFIHRDIKPHNVLLSGEERKFKFTDFGIAHADDMTRMTRAGDFIGTVKYMSPELLAAHRAGIDKRTDIYSLGVTLYEALTLTLPFKADSEEKLIGEILAGHYTEARQTNRRIPVDLETVLMKACNHDPDLRYQTAAEFADDLQRIVEGRPILAKRQSALSKGYKYVKRNYKTVLGIAAAVIVVAGGFLWQHYRAERTYRLGVNESAQVETSTEPTFTKIVVPGLTDYCALSPDGERIAFVADDSCLWVAPTHGPVDPTVAGAPVKLTEPMARWTEDSYPTWSADGNWIAFNARGTRDSSFNISLSMFVVPSAGGELREIPVKKWASDRWRDYRIGLSPDGKHIAFSSDSALVPGESINRCIYTMPVGGGKVLRLTDNLCDQPAYSPNGKAIAYVKAGRFQKGSQRPIQSDVCVTPLTGGESIRIATVPGKAVGPVWSPDSRMIAYGQWSEHTDLRNEYYYRELYVVRLSEEYQPLGSPDTVKLPYYSADLMGGWTSKNQIGLVLRTDERGGSYTIPSSGGVATQITSSRGYSPRWSPDGELMYYMDDTAIYSMPVESGKPSKVPITGMREVSYANCDISPDGKRFSIAGVKANDSLVRIYTVPVSGGEPTQLVFGHRYSGWPCWSPDGKWIAFGQGEYSAKEDKWIERLCITPSEGGEMRALVSGFSGERCKFASGQMAWSPDGKNIAYPSYQDDSIGGVSIVPVEGGEPELLVQLELRHHAIAVAWSPDGSYIAYCKYNLRSKSGGGIWILPLSTRQPYKLRTGLDFEEVWMISWSPDGEKIAFASHWPSESNLYLIENFLPSMTAEEPESLDKEMTVRKVWSGDDVDGTGMISFDGEFLPFIDWETGNLAVRWLDENETLYLTDSGHWCDKDIYWFPVPSPDGNTIAFTQFSYSNDTSGAIHRTADLCLIDIDGSNQRILVDCGHNERLLVRSFSPDGSLIAAQFRDSSGYNIALVSMGDGSVRVLKVLGKQRTVNPPWFSADGKYLAYDISVEGTPGNVDIFLLSVDDGSEVPLIEYPSDDQLIGWVPGSNSFLFLSDRSGSWDAWLGQIENGRLAGKPEIVKTKLGNIGPLGFARDSAYYYVMYHSWTTVGIGSIDSITGSIKTPLEEPLTGSNHGLTWSPDGEYTAYVSHQEAANAPFYKKFTLHVRSLRTGQDRVITCRLDLFSDLNWSPDSRYLLVRGLDPAESPNPNLITTMCLVDVDANSDTVIAENLSYGYGGPWSPDGKYVYFVSRDSLFALELATGQQEFIYHHQLLNTRLTISPSGEELAIGVHRDDCDYIMVLDIATGKTRELYQYPDCKISQKSSTFRWMPDGAYILFTQQEGVNWGPCSLWRIPSRGGVPEKIYQSPNLLGGLTVHPDGNRIAVHEPTGSEDIWVMKNFLPEDQPEQ